MRSSVLLLLLFLSGLAAVGQDKPKKASQFYEEAEAAYNDDRYKEAQVILDECLRHHPGYYEAYSLRGSIREILKDDEGALTDYSIYLDEYPDHLPVLMSRAILRFRMGFYDQAKEDFRRLLTMNPAETNTLFYRMRPAVGDKNPVMTPESGHKSYIYNYLGLIEARIRDHRTALTYYDSALALNPSEPDYLVNRGLSKEALNDSTAATDYRQALRINNRHTLARHNLTALLEKQGKTMTYEDRLSETIKEDSSMLYPYLERALQRFAGGFYRGAEEDYSKALEIDPSDEEIWLGRGLAREKQKNFDGAFSDYTRAIDLREDFIKAWINRGNVLYKLERYKDAIEDFNVVLIYQANNAPAVYNRAMAKARLKDKQGACADLKLAEQLGMEVENRVKSRVCE